MSLRPIELPSDDLLLSRFQTKTPARLVHLQNVLNTSAKGAMLARMRIPEDEFEIKERGEGLEFVRIDQKQGVFVSMNKLYLVTSIVVRNPTIGESDNGSLYERGKTVVVETFASGMRGPEFRSDGEALSVIDIQGKTYPDAFLQAREGEPADLLLTAVVASVVAIFFQRRPPQTTRPKIGILGL